MRREATRTPTSALTQAYLQRRLDRDTSPARLVPPFGSRADLLRLVVLGVVVTILATLLCLRVGGPP